MRLKVCGVQNRVTDMGTISCSGHVVRSAVDNAPS